MKLYKEASLMMLPTSVKDGKLYSVFPQDGDGDFTFSRGSNLAATRINEQGLIEKGRENLLLQSNQFDTTWVDVGDVYDLSSGQVGYDGSNGAWLINKTSTASYYFKQDVSTSGVQTLSFNLKSGTANSVLIFLGTPYLNVNIEEGTFGTERSLISKNIQDLGNGWKRVSMTFDSTLTVVQFQITNNNILGVTGSIYIQDAQLEAGLVATDYIESGATTGKAGVLEDLPRLDWGDCPSLLLEPQRQNLIDQSEYLNAFPTKPAISVTSNAAISPDGLQNASKLIPDTSNVATHYIREDVSVSSGSQYVMSFFAKKGEYNYVNTYTSAYSTGSSATWDLNAGAVVLGGSNADIEDYGNGWYRCIWKGTTNTTSLSYRIYVSEFEDRNTSFAGDGVKGVYIYGAQLEEGSYATSYIPTHGTSVTRSADDLGQVISFPTEIQNSSQFTIFYESSFLDASASANDSLRVDSPTGSQLFGEFQNNGRTFFLDSSNGTRLINRTISYTSNQFMKVAWVIDNNSLSAKLFIDGVLKNDASLLESFDLEDYRFGNKSTNLNYKELTMFPTALSDNECINLTSI